MADLIIPEGDSGFDLSFTVLDSAGNPYNLLGYTIKFKVWKPGFPSVLVVNGTCNIVSATDGTCTYTIAEGDFAVAGDYLFELELTKTGVTESTVTKKLVVTESG